MMDRNAAEQAYAFFHQKLKVFEHSPSERERDHIEDVIARYCDAMSPGLYARLSNDNPAFLREHISFQKDLTRAVDTLENWLKQ